MEFVLLMDPPRVTEQQHRIGARKANGQYVVYRDPRLTRTMTAYFEELDPYIPDAPMEGPLLLEVEWGFPCKKKAAGGTWKITRPDTDNMIKLLKDCMTRLGYWHDDSQVCKEILTKRWSADVGYIRIKVEALP